MTITQNPSNTTSHPPRCGLLDLPFEIRLGIYEDILCTERPIAITDGRPRPCQIQDIHLQPQLLRVCSQIHDEAADILYGCNTFETLGHTNGYSERQLWKWLSHVGNANVARLNKFKLSLLHSPPPTTNVYSLFCVETSVRLCEPRSLKYIAKYHEGSQQWWAELRPDQNFERRLETLFWKLSVPGQTWQSHDIMAIYTAAMRIRPRLKNDIDLSTVPERAKYFFIQRTVDTLA